MGFTRRATDKDATWQRGWTADTLADLATITATQEPKRGDVAFVIATSLYYAWMDDGTWLPFSGGGGGIGTPGIPGSPGMDGRDGEQGEDGIQGIQGIRGIQGIKGDQGVPGLDGEREEQTIEWCGINISAHARTHEPGGSDQMAVNAAAAIGSLRTLGGLPLTACAGDDFRLINDRNPTVHALSHEPGSTDPIAFVSGVKERGRSVAMGDWIAPAYDSNAFTPASNWVVESADQQSYKYTLIGKTMILSVALSNTSLSTATGSLNIRVPGGFSVSGRSDSLGYAQISGVNEIVILIAPNGATAIQVWRSGGSQWPGTSVNNINVYFTMTFAIP